MILNYNDLPMLAESIRDYILQGTVYLYRQPDGFDDRGTRYLLKISNTLVFRLGEDGNFILPPLDRMPENANLADIVELRRDR